jgi:hypothetical protein
LRALTGPWSELKRRLNCKCGGAWRTKASGIGEAAALDVMARLHRGYLCRKSLRS